MKDVINQTINIGDYVAYMGAGNKTAEYGLLILKVIDFTPKGVSCLRFDTDYQAKTTYLKKVALTTKFNKIVKVQPPQNIISLFDEYVLLPKMTSKLNQDIAKWVHGSGRIE